MEVRCLGLSEWCRVVRFYFFKQKAAYEVRISDWSSDVCSSDLVAAGRDRAAVDSVGEQTDRQAGVDVVEGDRLSRDLNETTRARIAEKIGRASCRGRVCQYV